VTCDEQECSTASESELISYLPPHVLVERGIGDEPLQPRVFVLELARAAELTHAQVRVLLLPHVERGFADAELAAGVDRRASLDLAEGIGDLLFGEFRSLHWSRSFVVDRRSRHLTLVLICRRFRGRRQLTRAVGSVKTTMRP